MAAEWSLSFGSVADSYARVRPGYPAAAVDFVLRGMQPRVVLDLGAGTGKLTQSLVGRAPTVLALDPDRAMLAELGRRHPEVAARVATAEHTQVAPATVDAIFVGQAMHWFQRPQADREMARILRPGGVAGLLWNFPDTDVDWVGALYDATTGASPSRLPQSVLAQGLFDTAEQAYFPANHQLAGPESVLALVHTWSWVIAQTAAERAETDRAVRAVLARFPQLNEPQIWLPTRTRVVRQYRR